MGRFAEWRGMRQVKKAGTAAWHQHHGTTPPKRSKAWIVLLLLAVIIIWAIWF